jgi:nitroimidazol reductase NimA-like FMN-containing flavoprotein (pyridoxamine 5'-phosphate oxidase superfamily)
VHRPGQLPAARQDVLVRTADGTELLTAARRQAPAALQVDNIVDWSRSGWSVLIRGYLAEVTDPDAIERVLSSDLRPWSGENRDHVVRLSGNEVTGRRIEPGPGAISVIQL